MERGVAGRFLAILDRTDDAITLLKCDTFTCHALEISKRGEFLELRDSSKKYGDKMMMMWGSFITVSAIIYCKIIILYLLFYYIINNFIKIIIIIATLINNDGEYCY